MKRLTALPRIRRAPEALRRVMARKRERRQNTAREQRELELAIAAKIRREVRGVAS